MPLLPSYRGELSLRDTVIVESVPSQPKERGPRLAGVVVEDWAELDQPENPPGTPRRKPTRRRCGLARKQDRTGKELLQFLTLRQMWRIL